MKGLVKNLAFLMVFCTIALPMERTFVNRVIAKMFRVSLRVLFKIIRNGRMRKHVKLEGKLHSVRVAATGIVVPTELKYTGREFMLQ